MKNCLGLNLRIPYKNQQLAYQPKIGMFDIEQNKYVDQSINQ